MFDDAFADLERQVEPGKVQVALFKLFDNPQSLQVVVKAVAVRAQQFVKFPLAGVPKGRVPDVMHESKRLGQVGVESQRIRYRAGDLRYFDRVREPVAEMVGKTSRKDLSFCFEAAEGPRMNYAVAIPGIDIAVGMRRLRVTPPARSCRIHRVGCQRHA